MVHLYWSEAPWHSDLAKSSRIKNLISSACSEVCPWRIDTTCWCIVYYTKANNCRGLFALISLKLVALTVKIFYYSMTTVPKLYFRSILCCCLDSDAFEICLKRERIAKTIGIRRTAFLPKFESGIDKEMILAKFTHASIVIPVASANIAPLRLHVAVLSLRRYWFGILLGNSSRTDSLKTSKERPLTCFGDNCLSSKNDTGQRSDLWCLKSILWITSRYYYVPLSPSW